GAQGLAGLLGEHSKGGCVTNGEIGEDLAIDLDAGLAESVDEGAVAHVVDMGRGIDADDPELAELALFVLAIAVGVLPAALDVFLGGFPEFAARAERTARGFHYLLLALQTRDVGSYPWHGLLLLYDRRRLVADWTKIWWRNDGVGPARGPAYTFADRDYATSNLFIRFSSPDVAIVPGRRRLRFRLADFLVRMWLLLALLRRTLPLPVIEKRFFAPLCVFIFGMLFPHLGARIIVMDFPSNFGSASILLTSTSSWATRITTFLPSSGCAIWRPRNIKVTFTLFPSPKNSRACLTLVWKSCSSMPGRNLTSLSSITCCFFLA